MAGAVEPEAPPAPVLRACGCAGVPRLLPGGSRPAWAVGELVLKRSDDERDWRWLGKHLADLPTPGIRLAQPVRAPDGRWTAGGWCAQERVPGRHPRFARWGDIVRAGEALHRALRALPRPDFLAGRTDPWAQGDRVAWEEAPGPRGCGLLDRLLAARRPLSLPAQLVHGDLTDNVLFDDDNVPAVIDFSPYWRPPGFASAVVVADAVCWRGADPHALCAELAHVEGLAQLLVRALIYRLVTTLVAARGAAEVAGYLRCAEFAIDLVRAEHEAGA